MPRKNAVSQVKNVAIYARVSISAKPPKKTGDAERDSKRREEWKRRRREAENQLRQLRDFAGKQGWQLVHEYVDQDSGSKSNRPHLTRMLADAAQRKFDLLLFWSLDRLSREGAAKTLGYLERLSSNGVEWWSLQEEYLRSLGPFSEAVLAILAVIAKQERIRISERTRAGLERVRDEGQQLGRPAVKFDLPMAKRLRREGKSLREIAKTLGVCPATVYHRLAA
jgi:DNA invertase Pin-like site-specific DNA recombinase